MHQSFSRSTFNAVIEQSSAEEQRCSRHLRADSSTTICQDRQPSLRIVPCPPLGTTGVTAAFDSGATCEPISSQKEKLPRVVMPLLREMSITSKDAPRLHESSDDLDGYCSSGETSVADGGSSSSSREPGFGMRSPTNTSPPRHRGGRRKTYRHHYSERDRQRVIRNAPREAERQRLAAVGTDDSAAVGEVLRSHIGQSTASAITTTASSTVSTTSGTAREGPLEKFSASHPNPITATTNTKTLLAMISAAQNVESRAAEAAKRDGRKSPRLAPQSAGDNESDVMRQQAPMSFVKCNELRDSSVPPRSCTESQPLRSSSSHRHAMVMPSDDVTGVQCSRESTPIVAPDLRTSSVGRSSQADNGVCTRGLQSRLPCGATASPSIAVGSAHLTSAAADLKKGSTMSDASGFLRVTADGFSSPQGATQGPTGESPSDNNPSAVQTGDLASGGRGVANVTTSDLTNATVLTPDASTSTAARHLPIPLHIPSAFEVSSSSSVGGHHLSITEGNAFLKQSGSRREEAFYNVIQPYQETLVREAVRQAPQTVQHWCRQDASATLRKGIRHPGTSPAESPTFFSGFCHQFQTSLSCQRSGDSEDGDGVVADPDDVAAMCEARWEAYQLFEAEDMSNLHILASEQLREEDAVGEHLRGGGGGDCAVASREHLPSPTSRHLVDKNLVELAARLWWTVRFRNFYRTSSAAYEVQRQAAEAANLSPSSPPLVSSSIIEQERGEQREESATGEGPLVALSASNVSGAATPCLAGSFVDPLSEGLSSGVSASERQYLLQKHRALQLLAAFVPRYHGTRCLPMRDVLRYEREGHATAAAASPTTVAKDGNDQPKVPGEGDDSTTAASTAQLESGDMRHVPLDADNDGDENKSDDRVCRMIMLEYVCYRFRHPCVMDIKMGSRQYGLHPAAEKKRSKMLKANLSTSARYGIRLAGYRRWDPVEEQYRFRSKLQCRFLSLNEVKHEISDFLYHNREIEHVFRRQLQRLRVAFSQQTIFRFYTSSLLFVYDVEDPLRTARVTMVDFAYTYESKELQQGGDPDAVFAYDVGYLKAIDTLLSLLA